MDLVRKGELLDTATLSPATVALEINRIFQPVANFGAGRDDEAGASSKNSRPVAVPQEKLDTLLAVRRWWLDNPQVITVSPPDDGETLLNREKYALHRWQRDALQTARTLLSGPQHPRS